MQQRASEGNRSRVDQLQVQQGTAASLSLKARETASLSLKRIFEQQIEAAARSTSAAPQDIHHVLLQGSHDDQQHEGPVLSTAVHHVDSHHQLLQDQVHASADGIDLELRLAAPYTSAASHTAEDEAIQTNHSQKVSVNEAGKAQLTIFYAGKVCVYEDVPADKVKAVMLLAAESGDRSRAKYGNGARKSRPVTPASCSDTLCIPAKPVSRSQAELPFARKASLTRFFEKRKERLEAKSAHSENEKLTATSEIESEPPQKRPCTTSKTFIVSTKL